MFGIGHMNHHAYATASAAAAAAVCGGVTPCGSGRGRRALSSFTLLFSRCSNNYNNNTNCINNENKKNTSINDAAATQVRSPDLVALEYADLHLPHKIGEVGHVRIRQHVNPLSASLSVPAEVPNWNQVFRDSTLPLMVDIGSGNGRFLVWLAKRSPETKNYLGLEIRHKLVERAQFWVKELALGNIYFMFANATVSFEQLVSTYPGPLAFVSILCPDPHFKKRHHKRRVVQKHLVDSVLKHLRPGGQVFIQSDVLDVALDMRNQFDARADILQHIDDVDQGECVNLCDAEGWLLSNPMGIRTEREIHAEFEGARIYRRMYQKR
ncbi:tRNA (guanine-N-7) methyltransferase [Macleaya cordata]|uniref:tRNA (guanine(46)-N(7))-methyltransferase n=1 Tax=Macleaya cordata TaxID=56857 RepID=A0A200R6M4_MACCD|nr:tRNA (guanine-N-7) methyltransferase [Macleaya cordata]